MDTLNINLTLIWSLNNILWINNNSYYTVLIEPVRLENTHIMCVLVEAMIGHFWTSLFFWLEQLDEENNTTPITFITLGLIVFVRLYWSAVCKLVIVNSKNTF